MAVSCLIVLRKASASIFLVVMSLLIALHSPVVGYCAEAETFFVGEFECGASLALDNHDCHGLHEEESAPSPCDGEHEMITLVSGDFLWSGLEAPDAPETICVPNAQDDRSSFSLLRRQIDVTVMPTRPPPDPSQFRRFSVLRL